jgi:hypothetical protein
MPPSFFEVRRGVGFFVLVIVLAFATLIFPLILKRIWLTASESSDHNTSEAVVEERDE